MNKKQLSIVAPNLIPKGQSVPLDDLISIFRLCTQMECICLNNDGIGLSAVQLGIPWNLFVVLKRKGRKVDFEYFIDCSYTGIGEKYPSVEGCLSLKDKSGNLKRYKVQRFEKIRLTGKQLVVGDKIEVKDVDREADGVYAVVLQHEIDHQNSILISDIGQEVEICR